jgi:hypothetical protein
MIFQMWKLKLLFTLLLGCPWYLSWLQSKENELQRFVVPLAIQPLLLRGVIFRYPVDFPKSD